MNRTRKLGLLLTGLLTHQASLADNLEHVVYEAIQTNPDMAVSVQNYYSSRAELDSAQGNFLPSLDLSADTGKEDIDRVGTQTDSNETRAQARLQLTIPVFRGFANANEYDRADFSMQASYYQSLAQAEQLALQITRAYTEVLNAQDVVRLSVENLELHENTYDLVEARKKQGVADKADLTQMKGRLSRVKANLLAAHNNLRDAETTYIQLTGTRPANLVRPQADSAYLPESNERAATLALTNNQNLIASRLNAQASAANSDGLNAHYYPNFDIVADQTWKDHVSGEQGHENEWRVLLEMNWNLYSGGRSNSKQKQARYQEEAARMRSNRIYREVQANVDSSWDAYMTLKQTLVHLQDYVDQSAESARLYMAQFKAGRRTLLDLLDAQNELFEARKQYLASDYQYVYAQYRVIASMSYILDALRVNAMKPLLEKGDENETRSEEKTNNG